MTELSFAEIMRRQKLQWERERQAQAAPVVEQPIARAIKAAPPPPPPQRPQPPPTPVPSGSPEAESTLPAVIEIRPGQSVTLADLGVRVREADGISEAAWAAMDPQARDDRLFEEIERLRGEGSAAGEPPPVPAPPSQSDPQPVAESGATAGSAAAVEPDPLMSLTNREIKQLALDTFGAAINGNKVDLVAAYRAAEAAAAK